MQYARVNDQRCLAQPGLNGACPLCGAPVIAKCGSLRTHHWSHLGKSTCDPWWEPEAEWHRGWKRSFPAEWQEIPRFDTSGEKHIADVRTAHGLTIEFQHSYIRADERVAREHFYGEMIWVVDGSRLVRDFPRFSEGARGFRRIGENVFVHQHPDELFPLAWLSSKVPVIFDFAGGSSTLETLAPKNLLWCLLPRTERYAVVVALTREFFLGSVRQDSLPPLWKGISARSSLWLASERERTKRRTTLYQALQVRKLMRSKRRYSKRWPRRSY